jgi:tyrosyl-tRNA synthetase
MSASQQRKSIDEQIRIIQKGADELISPEELKEKLQRSERQNTPLKVKLGLDPSAPDIHLGHAVVLRKIRQIQDLGHRAVIIIGDFTGMIGDPTGRSKTRRQLTREEVLKNARTYERQIFKILDKEKTEVRFNSEWLAKLNFRDVIELASKLSVARMLEREDFKNRFQSQLTIGIHEFFYPIMQAYDSMEIDADIELGGTDQRFNILMGRTYQKEFGKESQIALFMPILEGIDGVEKMSKSLGNYIGIFEEPDVMYRKIMQIPDSLIGKYFDLATDVHPDETARLKDLLDRDLANPRDIKMRLAREIVALYHSQEAAAAAEEVFVQIFQNKEVPDDVPETMIQLSEGIIEAVTKSGLAPSKSEARRLVKQGGVRVNGVRVQDFFDIALNTGDIIQVGKERFTKIIVEG